MLLPGSARRREDAFEHDLQVQAIRPEIEARGGEADLVGHDWGAGHVLGVVADRPDLVRSWATDCAGPAHPDYVWHDMAQAWQTPEVGEAAIGEMLGRPLEARIEMLGTMGLPEDVARDVAAGQGEEMGRFKLGSTVILLF